MEDVAAATPSATMDSADKEKGFGMFLQDVSFFVRREHGAPAIRSGANRLTLPFLVARAFLLPKVAARVIQHHYGQWKRERASVGGGGGAGSCVGNGDRSVETKMTLLPSSERGVLRDEPSDHLPRRKAPKELSRAAKALKERDRNAQAPKRLAEPQLELKPRGPRGGDLHKSTDKLNDILQFLNRADTSIDLDRRGS